MRDNETKTADNLPEGAMYEVTELETKKYQVGTTNNKGEIVKDDITEVTFTNTKRPDLLLYKIVTGETGDKTRKFTFVIHLKDKDGNPVNGDYEYMGGVKNGFEQETTKPEDGTITFVDGTAEISLSHGQQILLQNLPPKAIYKITEKEANQDHYTTTYNQNTESAEGILNDDFVVEVVNKKGFVPNTGTGDINRRGIGTWIAVSIVAMLLPLSVCFFRRHKGLTK